MTTDRWTGNAVHRARTYIGARLPLTCTQCHQAVNPGDDYAVAHLVPRWQRPDLALVPSNWGADHRRCSDASGQAQVIAKARHEAVSSGGPGPGQ